MSSSGEAAVLEHQHRDLAVPANLYRGGDYKLVTSRVGRLHLEMSQFSGRDRRKLKRALARQGSTGDVQQSGCVTIPRPGQHLPERLCPTSGKCHSGYSKPSEKE